MVTTSRSTSKVVSAHHFPIANSPDIRFNPSEINIRLNPSAPPEIRTKQPVSYQQQSYSNSDNSNSKVIVTTHSTEYKSKVKERPSLAYVPVLEGQHSAVSSQKVPASSTKPPQSASYGVTGNPSSVTPVDINYGFTYKETEYQTEQNYGSSSDGSYRPSTYRNNYQFNNNRERLSNRPTTFRNPTIFSSSFKPPSQYTYHRTEKPQKLQIPLPLIPTLPPLTFSSPAPFTLSRHVETKRFTNEHQAPRIIISASASVSDASGRRLNYSLGTIGTARLFEPSPSSYDEYKEEDVGLDPFYHDVQKVNNKRSKRSADIKPMDIIKSEQDAVDILKFLYEWYTNHEKTTKVSIPIESELITEINEKLSKPVNERISTEEQKSYETTTIKKDHMEELTAHESQNNDNSVKASVDNNTQSNNDSPEQAKDSAYKYIYYERFSEHTNPDKIKKLPEKENNSKLFSFKTPEYVDDNYEPFNYEHSPFNDSNSDKFDVNLHENSAEDHPEWYDHILSDKQHTIEHTTEVQQYTEKSISDVETTKDLSHSRRGRYKFKNFLNSENLKSVSKETEQTKPTFLRRKPTTEKSTTSYSFFTNSHEKISDEIDRHLSTIFDTSSSTASGEDLNDNIADYLGSKYDDVSSFYDKHLEDMTEYSTEVTNHPSKQTTIESSIDQEIRRREKLIKSSFGIPLTFTSAEDHHDETTEPMKWNMYDELKNKSAWTDMPKLIETTKAVMTSSVYADSYEGFRKMTEENESSFESDKFTATTSLLEPTKPSYFDDFDDDTSDSFSKKNDTAPVNNYVDSSYKIFIRNSTKKINLDDPDKSSKSNMKMGDSLGNMMYYNEFLHHSEYDTHNPNDDVSEDFEITTINYEETNFPEYSQKYTEAFGKQTTYMPSGYYKTVDMVRKSMVENKTYNTVNAYEKGEEPATEDYHTFPRHFEHEDSINSGEFKQVTVETSTVSPTTTSVESHEQRRHRVPLRNRRRKTTTTTTTSPIPTLAHMSTLPINKVEEEINGLVYFTTSQIPTSLNIEETTESVFTTPTPIFESNQMGRDQSSTEITTTVTETSKNSKEYFTETLPTVVIDLDKSAQNETESNSYSHELSTESMSPSHFTNDDVKGSTNFEVTDSYEAFRRTIDQKYADLKNSYEVTEHVLETSSEKEEPFDHTKSYESVAENTSQPNVNDQDKNQSNSHDIVTESEFVSYATENQGEKETAFDNSQNIVTEAVTAVSKIITTTEETINSVTPYEIETTTLQTDAPETSSERSTSTTSSYHNYRPKSQWNRRKNNAGRRYSSRYRLHPVKGIKENLEVKTETSKPANLDHSSTETISTVSYLNTPRLSSSTEAIDAEANVRQIKDKFDQRKEEVSVTDAYFLKSVNPTQAKKGADIMTTTPLSSVQMYRVQVNRNFIFNCFDKEINRFYSDPRDCRLFHYCTPGFTKNQLLDMKFVCDLGTYFDDEKLVCTKDMPTRCL